MNERGSPRADEPRPEERLEIGAFIVGLVLMLSFEIAIGGMVMGLRGPLGPVLIPVGLFGLFAALAFLIRSPGLKYGIILGCCLGAIWNVACFAGGR